MKVILMHAFSQNTQERERNRLQNRLAIAVLVEQEKNVLTLIQVDSEITLRSSTVWRVGHVCSLLVALLVINVLTNLCCGITMNLFLFCRLNALY